MVKRQCKICGEMREGFDYRDEQSQGCLFCEEQGLAVCHTCGHARSVENFGYYDTLEASGGLATCEFCQFEDRRKCFTCGETLPLGHYIRTHKTCKECIKSAKSYSGKRRCRVCGEVKNVLNGYAGKAAEVCMVCKEQELRDAGMWKSGLGTYETLDKDGLPVVVEKLTKKSHIINGEETGFCVYCGQNLSFKANFTRALVSVNGRREKQLNGDIVGGGNLGLNMCDECARASHRKGYVLTGKFCEVCRQWHPIEHYHAVNAKGGTYTHGTCGSCRTYELRRCRECGEVLHKMYFKKLNKVNGSHSTLCDSCRGTLK